VPFKIGVFIIIGSFWLLFGEKLREKIQTDIDQKWISDWYEPVKFTAELSSNLAPVLEPLELYEMS
jgi:hypothetical protein